MKEVKESVFVKELSTMSERMYGSIVKAVVDVDKNILVIDMDMYADSEAYLLNEESNQSSLWGINLHPDKFGTNEFVEFDSMINIRPRQNNLSRNILDQNIRNKIVKIIDEKVHE